MRVEGHSISEIRPYAGNPRINDQAVAAVAASIRAFGFRQPIVVDEAGIIIAGHTRYKAAIQRAHLEQEVARSRLSQAERDFVDARVPRALVLTKSASALDSRNRLALISAEIGFGQPCPLATIEIEPTSNQRGLLVLGDWRAAFFLATD